MPAITRRGVLAAGASVLLAGCGLSRDTLANVGVSNWTSRETRAELTVTREASGEVVIDESLTLDPDESWRSDSQESGRYEGMLKAGNRQQSKEFNLSDAEAVHAYVKENDIELVAIAA